MQDFHPLVSEWFTTRFHDATPAQLDAWPRIRAGRDVLVSAPTGSGKTLAAFLICLDGLLSAAAAAPLADRIDALYVSPLKALSNDIGRNLEAPLRELEALAEARGVRPPGIRVGVRTGDTPAAERARMLRRPPHILDEIHALVDDKRGSHLALSLARLDDLAETTTGRRPQRVGLSATVRPIGLVARFLGGAAGEPDAARSGEVSDTTASVDVVDAGYVRELDLSVEVPRDELGVVATNEMWAEIYDRIATLIDAHRTTLVFVNTRRLCERVAHHLAERLGEEAVLAYHGSLDRRL